MAYNPTTWVNDDGSGTVGTPVIANYMNNIEQGVKNNDEQINVLNDRIKKTVGNLSSITNEVLLKSTVIVNDTSATYIKLPTDYIGFITIQSAIKGEYSETYMVHIKNKYAYSITSMISVRFNNTSDEISTLFVKGDGGAGDEYVYLTISNNTAISGNFYVTITQNLNGGKQ